MTTTKTIPTILQLIENNHRFLIASHEGPDGDAIGSTLALTNLLREAGKDVVAYNRDGLPKAFSFLPGSSQLCDEIDGVEPFDVGFILDAGELRRAGSHLRDCCTVLINIDHHPCSEDFGDVYCLDTAAAATAVIIYRLIVAGKMPVSLDVATCLYVAILSDTGSFRYSNANAEAFSIAGELVAKGIDTWDVASALYETQPKERLQLLAQALSTLCVSPCGRYASVATTLEMMQLTGSGPEHTDGFVNYPRAVEGVEVAIYFRQLDNDQFKAGFRSKGRIDVGALARELGGGGHHNAAGATVTGSLNAVQTKVFARLDELL
ncbi:MAG: bifunctional oligoribonuclease/PAP phosphatase NrnA [Desulfuromonadales bacterium]|nr:bifunctional oligoribonuclease/PAP phosphatase NrnA [Desulfuromonadales bacterium]MDT8423903.1 bifunctional oligoribonuclease/PAP phosphatase NrnA [Desulfuromonadales bacterium]